MGWRLSPFFDFWHRENPYVFYVLAGLQLRLNKTGVHMNITLLRHARRIFQTYNASPEVIRSYQRKWARSVHQLGSNWLLAQHVTKVQ
jgi:hypothetical protein